jgi:hypothetical protein
VEGFRFEVVNEVDRCREVPITDANLGPRRWWSRVEARIILHLWYRPLAKIILMVESVINRGNSIPNAYIP